MIKCKVAFSVNDHATKFKCLLSTLLSKTINGRKKGNDILPIPELEPQATQSHVTHLVFYLVHVQSFIHTDLIYLS